MSRPYYMVCGFPIEIVDPPYPPPPYTLVVTFHWGRELIIEQGHNPISVREAHTRVSRNPKVIDSIQLRDSSGLLETIWRSTWT